MTEFKAPEGKERLAGLTKEEIVDALMALRNALDLQDIPDFHDRCSD